MLSSTRLPRSSTAACVTVTRQATDVRSNLPFMLLCCPRERTGVMSASLPRLTRFADGITAVDTEYVRPQMDASHVIVSGSRAAIVDTGSDTAVPLILAALAELGIERDAVDYLFLTHVHLDLLHRSGQM